MLWTECSQYTSRKTDSWSKTGNIELKNLNHDRCHKEKLKKQIVSHTRICLKQASGLLPCRLHSVFGSWTLLHQSCVSDIIQQSWNPPQLLHHCHSPLPSLKLLRQCEVLVARVIFYLFMYFFFLKKAPKAAKSGNSSFIWELHQTAVCCVKETGCWNFVCPCSL